MAQISVLRCDEAVSLDPDRLVVLYAELGQTGAERVISAAMEDLAVHLAAVQIAARTHDKVTLRRVVDEMERLACQVGMYDLAGVARNLLDCVICDDGAAKAAVLARLLRIGDRSLTAVWDAQDIRG